MVMYKESHRAVCSAAMRDRQRIAAMIMFALLGGWTAAHGQAPDPPAGQQGNLSFFGCEVDPADVFLRARAIRHKSETGGNPGPPVRGETNVTGGDHVVHPVPGSTPGVFTYAFDDLTPGMLYRFGIRIVGTTARACPRFAWNASRDTYLYVGSERLDVEGYALRSELEVLGAVAGTRHRPTWVGGDSVDFFDPQEGTRQFRWRTTLPGVTGGLLQIALQPFPKPGEQLAFDPCRATGVVHTRTVQVSSSGWTDVGLVDFSELLSPRPGVVPTSPISENTQVLLQLGMPLYVRVLPTIGDQAICDPAEGGAPSEVVVAKVPTGGPPPPAPPLPALAVVHPITYKFPEIDPENPTWGKQERCYRVIKDHPPELGGPPLTPHSPFKTMWDFYLADKGLAGAIGDPFCVTESTGDDGWFESLSSSVTSFVTAVVDGIATVVNFASKTWEDIQDKVVEGVAAGLDATGIVDCDATCKKALEFALETALASMGIPPSIPNFDALVDQGIDYLAAQAASEVGVPPEIANLATEKAKTFAKAAVANMRANVSSKGLPDWLVLDVRLDAPVVALPIVATGAATVGVRPLLIRGSDPIFAAGQILLPVKLPGLTEPPLVVPMLLPPNLYGLPEPPPGHTDYGNAVWFKDRWLEQRYAAGCYRLVVTGLVQSDVIPLVDVQFDPATSAPCVQ
jgi:hypothetical protein